MGMGTPDGCALVFGLLKAWTAADRTKCILSIDAGGTFNDQQNEGLRGNHREMEHSIQPMVWDPRKENLVLKLKLSPTWTSATEHNNPVGETRKLKNPMGPSRRPIRR